MSDPTTELFPLLRVYPAETAVKILSKLGGSSKVSHWIYKGRPNVEELQIAIILETQGKRRREILSRLISKLKRMESKQLLRQCLKKI